MEYREFTEEELIWIKSFQRIMKKAPNTLFMFVGGSQGTCYIYPKKPDGDRYMTGRGGGVDSNAPSIDVVSPMEMDGGDW
jgi:hypothetical protein